MALHRNLRKRNLGRIAGEMLADRELEALVLADNLLKEIPPEIGALQRLRMLDLGHNQLTVNLRDFLYLDDNPVRWAG